MPLLSRITRIVYFIALLAPMNALAQGSSFGSISGTVTNKTTGKAAAHDTVTLIRLAQGMQESTVTHTDARGHYTIELPDAGIHLIRVTHDKANYFGAAPPGATTVDVAVYSAEPKLDGVTTPVEELHIEATDTELHIVEVLEVQNDSAPARTQFGPNGFDFYLPEAAHIERTGAVADGGMPVPASAAPVTDHAGHYTFLFPIRPGETQFGIFYSLPYAKSIRLPLHLANPVHTLAIVLPKSMKLEPGATPFALSPASGDASQTSQTQTWIAQNVSTTQTVEVTISGTGTLPQQTPNASSTQSPADANAAANVDANGKPDPTKFGGGLGKPIDPEADRDPWAKYKGWILGGLALLLAIAAGVLLRKPAQTARLPTPPVAPASTNHTDTLRDTLKEEFFALETDRLQNKISEAEYAEHKRALDAVLLRALARSSVKGAKEIS